MFIYIYNLSLVCQKKVSKLIINSNNAIWNNAILQNNKKTNFKCNITIIIIISILQYLIGMLICWLETWKWLESTCNIQHTSLSSQRDRIIKSLLSPATFWQVTENTWDILVFIYTNFKIIIHLSLRPVHKYYNSNG